MRPERLHRLRRLRLQQRALRDRVQEGSDSDLRRRDRQRRRRARRLRRRRLRCGEPVQRRPAGAREHARHLQRRTDNDDNGYTDCADFSCTMSMDQSILDYCASVRRRTRSTPATTARTTTTTATPTATTSPAPCRPTQQIARLLRRSARRDTLEKCSNGDGRRRQRVPPTARTTRARVVGPEVFDYCADDSRDHARDRCTDGIDNDCNGYTDCADHHCRDSMPDVSRQVCQESIGATSAEAAPSAPTAWTTTATASSTATTGTAATTRSRRSARTRNACATSSKPRDSYRACGLPALAAGGRRALLGGPRRGAQETNCTDGMDDDGDTVYDCGDADCKDDPACKPDGASGEHRDTVRRLGRQRRATATSTATTSTAGTRTPAWARGTSSKSGGKVGGGWRGGRRRAGGRRRSTEEDARKRAGDNDGERDNHDLLRRLSTTTTTAGSTATTSAAS